MYKRVAKAFADRIRAIFANEDTLKAAHEKYFQALPFDRTDRWNVILRRELTEVWKEHGPVVKSDTTPFDEGWILWFLAQGLDYPIFTQVLLNLQPNGLITYGSGAERMDELKKKWEGKSPSPFDAKAKMHKVAAPNENLSLPQIDFNMDLSTLKALKIVAGATSPRSFRVSPVKATPALTDSENLSMLGVGGDRFLRLLPGTKAYYFTWEQTPQVVEPGEQANTFFESRIPAIEFESKSGGDILNEVIMSRLVTYLAFSNLDPETAKAFLPRMHSVLLVTDARTEEIWDIEEALTAQFGNAVRIEEGARGQAVPAA